MLLQVITDFKMLLQELCKRKLVWGEEVSDELCKVWEMNLKKLEEMTDTVVPMFHDRDEKDQIVSRQLHGFSDVRKGLGCVFMLDLSLNRGMFRLGY